MTTQAQLITNFSNSQALQKEGEEVIAGFTQSMMKKPQQFSMGNFPVYLERGDGAEVVDVDGNRYVDFICGLGANMLGHNHPKVVEAITQNLDKGLIHSLPAPVEITTAKRLCSVIPGGEMVRFFKTGADANSAAVRLARYVSNKEKIITVGYNGWHDQYMFDTPGVPQAVENYTFRMPLFTPQDEAPLLLFIEEQGHELAALLLSVPYTRELSQEFVQKVQQTCKKHDVLFIMDEVVTGFRLALGGAQEYFNVQADMVTLSKGLAAGMPLSAVVGSQSLMSQMEDLQVSTTFGGEMLSLEVCCAALDEYQHSDCLAKIAKLGNRLKTHVNEIAKGLGLPLKVVGYDAIPMFMFAPNPVDHAKLAEVFVGLMAKRGVLLRRDVNFISAVHTEQHIDNTVQAIAASLEEMIALQVFEKSEEEAFA